MERLAEWKAKVVTANYRVIKSSKEDRIKITAIAKAKLKQFLSTQPATNIRHNHIQDIAVGRVELGKVVQQYIDDNNSYEMDVDRQRAINGEDTCMKWLLDAVTEVLGEEPPPPPPTPQPSPPRPPPVRASRPKAAARSTRGPPSPPYVPPPVIRDRMPPVTFNIHTPTVVEAALMPPPPPSPPMNAQQRRQKKRNKTQKSPSHKNRKLW